MREADALIRLADERAVQAQVREALAWGLTPVVLREAMLAEAGVHPVDADYWASWAWQELDVQTRTGVRRVAGALWPIVNAIETGGEVADGG